MPYGFNDDKSKYDLVNINSNLATVESGTTASKNYDAGEYVVVGGQLHKAKTAITSGETFVVDTNIEVTDVGAELSDINSGLTITNNTLTATRNNLTSLTNIINQFEEFTGTVAGIEQTFYRKRIGNLYIICGVGGVYAPVGAGAVSQRNIDWSNRAFSSLLGAACNMSMEGVSTSGIRYCATNPSGINAWVENPSSVTSNNVFYNFIAIGSA